MPMGRECADRCCSHPLRSRLSFATSPCARCHAFVAAQVRTLLRLLVVRPCVYLNSLINGHFFGTFFVGGGRTFRSDLLHSEWPFVKPNDSHVNRDAVGSKLEA